MNTDQNQQLYNIQELKEILNASQEYMKLTDLELNVEYVITDGGIINTLYGNRVQLMLNNKYKILLPNRYTNLLTNDYIQALVINKINLIYKGKKDIYNNQTKHDIVFV